MNSLALENLLPEIIQMGNEINSIILYDKEEGSPMNLKQNATLINKRLKAVRVTATAKNIKIELLLHVAQPENGLWWFQQATANGITNYGWIGLSYYPLWSESKLNNIATAFATLKNTYNKRLMVVETAYPFTMDNKDPRE